VPGHKQTRQKHDNLIMKIMQLVVVWSLRKSPNFHNFRAFTNRVRCESNQCTCFNTCFSFGVLENAVVAAGQFKDPVPSPPRLTKSKGGRASCLGSSSNKSFFTLLMTTAKIKLIKVIRMLGTPLSSEKQIQKNGDKKQKQQQ
jgi:hypothetical protein